MPTRLLLLSLLLSATAFADDGGWWLGVGCPANGTYGVNTFTACKTSNCDVGQFYSGGDCTRTSTLFTKMSFTTTAGGTLNASTAYSLHTGDVLITPAILDSEEKPVFAVQSACPVSNATLNWIVVQWDSGVRTMSNTYLLGTASYSTVSGIIVTGQYDIDGSVFWAGPRPMPGTCSNGVYSVSDPVYPDLNGTVYFTGSGGGVYKTTPGHATFFFPQYTATLAPDLGSKTAAGVAFDSRLSSNTSLAKVTTNAGGDQFTITPYTDVETGDTTGAPYTDVISITATNSPQPGMLRGTISRDGGPPTGIACIVNKTLDSRVICSGGSPEDPAYPYTVAFVVESVIACPTNYVRVPANPDVGVLSDFCVAKYEMKIQGDANGNQNYNSTWVAESRASGTPWTRTLQSQATTECQALGAGYDLISNAQWQTVARNIEDAYNAGAYLNWSNGRQDNTPSQNNLNRGNTDATPGTVLAASTDDDPCNGTGNTNCENNTHADFIEKRTHQLSNGEILWDLGGNVWEWVKDSNGATQGTDGFIYLELWTAGGKTKWGPRGSYTAGGTYPKTSSPYGGFGTAVLNASAGTVFRGGNAGSTAGGGIFYTALQYFPGNFNSALGFRCVFSGP